MLFESNMVKIGIDLGGTKIEIVALDKKYHVRENILRKAFASLIF